MSESLYVSNTAGTLTTVPTTDTAIVTANLKPNQYNVVRVVCYYTFATTGTSSNQTIAVKLKQGTTVKTTYNIKANAVIGQTVDSIEYMGDLSAGGAISVTISAAATDAQTSFTSNSLYITSVQ